MIPILITQFAQAGMGLIDTIMAGHFSATDLAAIAVGVGIWIPVMLLFTGIILATTPLVAEAVGAKESHNIPYIVRQSLWVAFILGSIALIILQFMPLLLPLFGVPADLQPKASLFLHAVGFGMPAVTMYATLRCYSEAIGHPRPVTVISLLSLIILIPLDYIFMYGIGPLPVLGSAGCGFATAILQWLMLAILAIYIHRANTYRKHEIFKHWENIDFALTKRILKLGVPIGLAIFFEVSIFSTAAIIISPLGDTVVAAHQIAISITSQLFMIPMSLAIALTIRVGMYYGEKNWSAMRKAQKVGLGLATSFAFVTMLI
ncbi:MAG: MATE family efflux transporter, partial [Acinetobacter sp.]